ncbi:MAG: aminopeptidase P N-terminal domain-containing protein [Polyangiaceae bacterium]
MSEFPHTAKRELYKNRRAAFVRAMREHEPASVAVLAATPVWHRNSDVEHEYRQDSDVHYLTGFAEPESVVVLSSDADGAPRMTLFVRPRDPERETWDGPRAGVDGAVAGFGADKAFPISELATELPKLLEDKRRLYYRVGRDRTFDDKVFAALDRARGRAKLGHDYPTELVEPGTIVHEMRLFKDDEGLASMRRAAEITAIAHAKCMAVTKPGMHEYEVEAVLLDTFRRHGSERAAYGSIVGSGPNATILHYRSNDRKMNDGELLLIDAGCEYGYYASDVTRTFPVSGTFSEPQRKIYELVLAAQLAGLRATAPGATLETIHQACVEVLSKGLVELGLLAGPLDEVVREAKYKRFYMHKTSHFLGMDVHDVGRYHLAGKPRELRPGMVLTVEPGLYVSASDETVDPQWRGIGVRIEDDLLVTESGHENLTRAIPKTVAEVEAACRATV